jgi:hypothetical protein
VGGDETFDADEIWADADRRARERRERAQARARRRPRTSDPVPRPHSRTLRFRGATAEARHLAATPAGRILIGACAAIAALTVAGLVALWPGDEPRQGPSQAFGGATEPARILAVREVRCQGPTPQRCRQIVVAVGGSRSAITLGPVAASPLLERGQAIRVAPIRLPPGANPAGTEPYAFVDVDRQRSVVAMGAALALLALVLLWWRGLLAAVGVGLSVLLLTTFLVPALLQGRPAVLTALVAALAVMFVTLVLTNGVGAQTFAAVLGVTATLLLIAALADLCVALAHLDGRSNELSVLLSQQNRDVSLRGIVLAGMVVGALGVLADTAVTQASAVMALRRTDPRLGARGLYRRAFIIGRDHLSATIHTLVLAYAGATLPLLLVMRSSGVAAPTRARTRS